MAWFYLTIEKVQRYNVSVEAENEKDAEAKGLATNYADYEPDEVIEEVTHVEEAKRYVE